MRGRRRIERAYADRLLAGDMIVTGDLAYVLAIASAAPEPAELVGEDAAAAAFRAVRDGVALPVARQVPRPAWSFVARLACGVIVAGVVIGGAAFAASIGGGQAPSDHHGTPGSATGTPATEHPIASTPVRPSGTVPAATGSATPSTAPQPTDSPAGSPTTSPTVPPPVGSLRGQCHRWAVAVAHGRTIPVTNAAFARLVAAAGGVDHIASYCAALLGAPSASLHQSRENGAGTSPVTSAPHSHGKSRAHAKKKA